MTPQGLSFKEGFSWPDYVDVTLLISKYCRYAPNYFHFHQLSRLSSQCVSRLDYFYLMLMEITLYEIRVYRKYYIHYLLDTTAIHQLLRNITHQIPAAERLFQTRNEFPPKKKKVLPIPCATTFLPFKESTPMSEPNDRQQHKRF